MGLIPPRDGRARPGGAFVQVYTALGSATARASGHSAPLGTRGLISCCQTVVTILSERLARG
jgi:hypothetical protein